MANRDLMPWTRQRENVPARTGGDWSPLFGLHREVDRLFDDVFGRSGRGLERGTSLWPSVDVDESDTEVRVTAELPGMNEDDIDLRVEDGMLTLRGERKDERDDKARGYSERFYGRFERRIALPRGVDEKACEATFRDGVLTVALPKSRAAESGRRIPINTETHH